MFGKAKLCEILVACSASSARDICAEVMRAAAGFMGSNPQEDDITLVVIKAL